MMLETIGFEYQLAKLELKPDDIVVLKTPRLLNRKQMDELREWLQEIVGPDRRILVLAWDCDIAQVSKDAIDRERYRMLHDFDDALDAIDKWSAGR